MSTALQRYNGPDRGELVREEFGALEQQQSAETASTAVAARERAQVEAIYVWAERHPRNWDRVRVNILAHCKRPRFAEAAKYRKPVGKKFINGEWREQFVEGLSARFAETASQEATNVMKGSLVTFEDDMIRIVRAFVADVERNVNYSAEVTVAKAVERKGRLRKGSTNDWLPPEGREVLSERLNSHGEKVYLVRATDDELKNKQNSEISKVQRNFVLQLLPPDIKEEAREIIDTVLADPNATDPTAAKKRLIDAFVGIGVQPDDLVTYVGHSLEKLTPAQTQELRGLFTAIRDGETSFQDALKSKYDTPAPDEEETTQQRQERHQRQMAEQARVAQEKIAQASQQSASAPAQPDTWSADDEREATAQRKRGRPPKQAAAPAEAAPSPMVELSQEEKLFNSIQDRRKLFDQYKHQIGDERYYEILARHGGALNFASYQDMRAALEKSPDAVF